MLESSIFDRKYRWSIMTYASPSEFQPLLNKAEHYLYIYHNRDKNENHYHILLTFKQQISLNNIRSIINSTQNTFGEPLKDNNAMAIYLTHEEESDKEIYSIEEFVSDNLDFWFTTKKKLSKEEENEQFIYDLLNLSKIDMVIKYGKDFIKNYEKYEYFRHLLLNEENSSGSDNLDF